MTPLAQTSTAGRRRLLAAALALLMLASMNVSASLAGATTRAGHGVLAVTTQPALPATIFVDGVARNTGQLEGLELPTGEHQVTFSEVDGFLPPQPETIDIQEGATTTLAGQFTPAGVLDVATSPEGLGTTISVDGIERDRGAVSLTVAAGDAQVCASEVAGYVTPDCSTVTVEEGATNAVELAFTPVDASDPDTDSARVSEGLVSFYDFTAGSGDTIEDLVGSNDLTIADPSAVSWVDDGLSFDEPTIARTSSAPKSVYESVSESEEFTVEAWVTPANTTQNGPARIVSLGRNTSNTNLLIGQGEYNGSSTMLETRLHERTGDYKLQTDDGTLGTDLTHIAVTRSKDATVSVHLDGELVTQREMAVSLNDWDASYLLGLGAELTGERPWLGTFHLTAIYDTALDANDVATNHEAGPEAATSLAEPEPATEPESEPEPQPTPPVEAPASWQKAFDAGDIQSIRAWYEANTGHEANGYAVSDLDSVGNLVTSRDGQVIDGVLASSIRIAHDDVTIRNSRVTSSWGYGISYADTWGQKVGGTLIEHVTFDGWKGSVGNDNHAAYLAANSSGATVRRVRVSGYASGVSMRSNTSFEESWVRDLWRPDTSVSHGTSSTIRGPGNAAVRNLLEGPGYSSALSMYADHGGPLHDALVEYNVMNDGQPYYQINIPNRTHSSASENVRVRHNRFGPAARAPYIAGAANFSHPSNDIRDNRAL